MRVQNKILNPFTATGRIYTSPKRPSRWPRTYIYTSHLNFVSTHLSKPGHRRGCCCMSPRCLLRQFVDHCLLFWAFFFEKTVLLCLARVLSKWRETALWLFPDATSWYELYVDGFRYDGDRGESSAGFVLLKARATNDGGYLLGEETSDGGAWRENDHTSAVNEDLDVSIHSERSPGHSLRRGIVGTNVRASLRVKHCESAVRRNPKQERCVRTLVK